MNKIEVYLELTQEEANKIAAALGFAWRNSHSHSESYTQLLTSVAQLFRNATRDAETREADDDRHAWVNRGN